MPESASRGGGKVSLAGGSPWRGVSLWQGGLLGGWGLLGRGKGGVVSQHALRQTPPPVDRITDTSKNITLATTSLRPVIRGRDVLADPLAGLKRMFHGRSPTGKQYIPYFA